MTDEQRENEEINNQFIKQEIFKNHNWEHTSTDPLKNRIREIGEIDEDESDEDESDKIEEIYEYCEINEISQENKFKINVKINLKENISHIKEIYVLIEQDNSIYIEFFDKKIGKNQKIEECVTKKLESIFSKAFKTILLLVNTNKMAYVNTIKDLLDKETDKNNENTIDIVNVAPDVFKYLKSLYEKEEESLKEKHYRNIELIDLVLIFLKYGNNLEITEIKDKKEGNIFENDDKFVNKLINEIETAKEKEIKKYSSFGKLIKAWHEFIRFGKGDLKFYKDNIEEFYKDQHEYANILKDDFNFKIIEHIINYTNFSFKNSIGKTENIFVYLG